MGKSSSEGFNEVSTVFWPAGFGDRTIEDLIEITHIGGFDELALSPLRMKETVRSYGGVAEFVHRCEDKNIRPGPVDGIARWTENWRPSDMSNDLIRAVTATFDIDLHETLDIAAALGMTTSIVVALFDDNAMHVDEIAEAYSRLCEHAASYQISAHFELAPFFAMPSLTSVWEMIKKADQKNSGICIDTWHLQKGSRDFAKDIELLSSIPGRYLQHVQLADADISMRAPTLLEDVMFRKLPGEGELGVSSTLNLIAKKGHLKSAGPEVLNSALLQASNADVGKLCGSATRNVLAAL